MPFARPPSNFEFVEVERSQDHLQLLDRMRPEVRFLYENVRVFRIFAESDQCYLRRHHGSFTGKIDLIAEQ